MKQTLGPLAFFVGLVATGVGAESAAASGDVIVVRPGFAQTFPVASGTAPRPGPSRETPIGPEAAKPGEIAISLAPAGHAVQVAKLHVYERTKSPIAFKASAMKGKAVLATQLVCGLLDMDAWITVPATTSSVEISDFAEAKQVCPN